MSALEKIKANAGTGKGKNSEIAASGLSQVIKTAASDTKRNVCESSYLIGREVGKDIKTAAAESFVRGINDEMAGLSEVLDGAKKYGRSVRVASLTGQNPLLRLTQDSSNPPPLLWSNAEAH